MGAAEYKARSGRVVVMGEDGALSIDYKRGYLSPEVVMDVEEWAQAQRDIELGRWRWPENPDLVVYPNHGDGQVSVIDERDGSHSYYSRRLCATTAPPRLDGMHAAAHAYFDAHPDRKPWHEAQPGEVWALTVDGREDAYIDRIGEFHPIRPSVVVSIAHDYSRITEGRRIWPEDAS